MVKGSNQYATDAPPSADALDVGNEQSHVKAAHGSDTTSRRLSTPTISTAHQYPVVSETSPAQSINAKGNEEHAKQASATEFGPQLASLRRSNGHLSKSRATEATTRGSSVTSTQPVLVRTYDDKMKASKSTEAKGLGLSIDQRRDNIKHDLPPISAFSFQDILAAIDPEVRGSIDMIAEICGKSKLSLANEYDSHRLPQGELDMPSVEESAEAVQSMLHHYLEPVEETASSQGQSSAVAHASATESSYDTPNLSPAASRSTTWALLGLSSPTESESAVVTSAPVTQLHQITSHQYSVTSPSGTHQQTPGTTIETSIHNGSRAVGSDGKPHQNLLAWLQQFQAFGQASQERSNPSGGGQSATETLKGILGS